MAVPEPAGTDLPSTAPTPTPAVSWYALGVLTVMSFFAYMDRSALAILLQAIKADLHLTDTQLGLLSGLAFAAFYSTLGIPLARLADRSSRVKLLAGCLALWSVMTALSGVARNFPQLFLARMGVGVGEAGCVPTSHSLIGDYFPARRRALAITIFQSGATLGLSGGYFVVAVLAHQLGWRHALQVIGLAGVPLAILILLTVPEGRRAKPSAETRESARQAISAILKRPAMRHLVIAYALCTICTFGVTQWSPTYLIRSFGMTMTEVGAWSGLTVAVGSISGLLSGGLLATWLAPRDRRWELRLPAITMALCVPLFAIMFLAPTAWLALLMQFLAKYFSGLGGGVALAAVQTFAEPHRRATAVSIMLFLSSLLGLGLGPYMIGAASDLLAPTFGQESLRYALLVACVLIAWSVIHFVLAERRTLQDRVN
jgi:predicted MFS family arabinose efflux permease